MFIQQFQENLAIFELHPDKNKGLIAQTLVLTFVFSIRKGVRDATGKAIP